ncbi:hypothetical protein [Novimethylophilus kurashikiensis]|uniref:hypothetical protein n=1 Tax=Novimethylophilus kurashikiensis TaxID=1825523 RepID=UPI0011B29823|nr:hypothetical protein [Novimethylophilus kurashikiensis]
MSDAPLIEDGTFELNLNTSPVPLCKHCGRQKGNHRANTLQCPIGRGSFPDFHPEQRYEPRKTRKLSVVVEDPRQVVRRDWVDCPICGEPDMRKETSPEGAVLIFCVNHACASNGGDNANRLLDQLGLG